MARHMLHSGRTQRGARLLAVATAVLASVALWFVAEVPLGIQLQAPAGTASPEPIDIGPLNVALASLVLSLVAWRLLAALERLTQHARTIWVLLALVGLGVSLSMPLSGTAVSAADRVVLVVMHLVVAAILIPVFSSTSQARPEHLPPTTSAVADGPPRAPGGRRAATRTVG